MEAEMKMKTKTVVLLFMVASLFVACGKGDKKGGNTGSVNNVNIQDMRANIQGANFQAVSYDRSYSFTSCLGGYQTGDWKTFSIPNYANNCQYGERSISSGGVVTHSQGNTEAEVKAYLVSLLSRAVEVRDHAAKACYTEFKAADGYIYIIDRTHPLITNPVSRRSANGSEFYMYSGYTRPLSDNDCNRIQSNNGQGSSNQNNSGDFDFFF